MKKIITMLAILVSGMVQAQEFDFTCEPQFEGWTHTPVTIDIYGDGVSTTYNFITTYDTTVIGDEFTFQYNGPNADGSISLYTGIHPGVSAFSNGSYYIVKYSNDDFLIIQGHQIDGNGRVNLQGPVRYNSGSFTWQSYTGPLTIGELNDPTITDTDFIHTPGDVEIGGYEFNTATSSEERFEFNRNWEEGYIPQIGDWSPREFDSDNLFIHVSPSDAANYPHGGYVVMKQQDVTDVNDVFILKIDQPTPNVPGDGNGGFVNRIRMYSVHTPTSWSREDNKPIQLGIIANPTAVSFDHTPGDVYSSDRTQFWNTTTTRDEDRFVTGSTDPGTWRIAITSTEEEVVQLVVEAGAGYDQGDFVVIKQQDATDVDDLLIGEIVSAQSASQVIFLNVKVLHSSYELIEEQSIQVGEIADPTEVRVNLRVEIAQSYASNYSAVEDVAIQSDLQSNDDGGNNRILMEQETDLNTGSNPIAAHFFQEEHPVSWFDDATNIYLHPRTAGLDPATKAVRTIIPFSPPATPVHGETYTYKYFARDGGYDIANADLRSLPFHFELDPDFSIAGIPLQGLPSWILETDSIQLDPIPDVRGSLAVGDKVLIVYGDYLLVGTVGIITPNVIHVNRVSGHGVDQYGVIDKRGAAPKLYKRK